jgi:hypothetical protein
MPRADSREHSAVDRKFRSCKIRAFVGRQEHHELCYLLGRAPAPVTIAILPSSLGIDVP